MEEDDFGDLYADIYIENSNTAPPDTSNVRFQSTYEIDEDADEEEVLYGRPSSSAAKQQEECPQKPATAGEDLERETSLDEKHSTHCSNVAEVVEAKGEGLMEDTDQLNETLYIQQGIKEDFNQKLDLHLQPYDRAPLESQGLNEAKVEAESMKKVLTEGEIIMEKKSTSLDDGSPSDVPMVVTQQQDLQEGILDSEVKNESLAPSKEDMQIPGLGLENDADKEGNGENWLSQPTGCQEDVDSDDSEDDLRIVLDNAQVMYSKSTERRDQDFEEGSDDEDLVIVAGDRDQQQLEEQEWVGEPNSPFDGAVSTSGGDKVLVAAAERNGDDKAQPGKGNVPLGMPAAPRLGYSGQHFHPNYSQFKYVRPGSAPNAGAPAFSGSVQNNKQGIGAWAPGKILPGAGRGSVQRNSFPGGPMQWNSSPGFRGFQNGFDFTLPPNKTVVDIDIDSFEEKPWRLPGVDASDFFNFNFDEDSWKEYCKNLEQQRLEATMQSKIRVYESGRSEQEYDSDMPLEIQSNTFRNEAFAENMQHKASDAGLGARGRGSGRGRVPIPMGRAIQVEGGIGERRPSVDFRRPRNHDSDAVIEIVVHGASDDENTDLSKAPENVIDVNESMDSEKGDIDMNCSKQVRRESSFQTPQIESWDNDNRKVNPICGMPIRTLHHGDGILPLPPGPPMQCPPNPIAGPGILLTRMSDQQYPNRRSQVPKQRVFSQLGSEYSNGSFPNADVKSNRPESSCKEISSQGLERITDIEMGDEAGDTERDPSPDASGRNIEHGTMDMVHGESRSDGQSKRSSECRVDKDMTDDRVSDQSVKKQKKSLQNESPRAAGGHSCHFKTSKGSTNKTESGNSRDHSKDWGANKEHLRVRGNGEEGMSQYRPQKGQSKERNKIHSDEDAYAYHKDHLWNSRHSSEKDSRYKRSRGSLNHHKDDFYLHGDMEDMHRRRSKDERYEKYKERDEYAKSWQSKIEDVRSLREKIDDSRRRDAITKEDTGQHRDVRDRSHDVERDDRHDLSRKKDYDVWHSHGGKEDNRRKERDASILSRSDKVDDSYLKRKRDDDLPWRERATKDEILHNVHARDDMGGEKHDRMDDYRRRKKKEDELRRERNDREQNARDGRERTEMGREKHERDDAYVRKREESSRRRERTDKELGISDTRERDDVHKGKADRDIEHSRRKDEGLHRKDRADKAEVYRDMRDRDDSIRDKHDRDDDYHLKRKEEESRRRGLFEDSRSKKQRDESWRRREREDGHWRRYGLEESHSRREREESKSLLASRNRHHSEEKLWHSTDKERVRSRDEAALHSLEKDRLKEKRKHEEQRAKAKDRMDDSSKVRYQECDDMHSRIDRPFLDERSSRVDRSHHRHDHLGSSHSVDDQKSSWEKRSCDPHNGSLQASNEDKIHHERYAQGRKKKPEENNIPLHRKKVSQI
eukprot:TRINITY_DN3030_c0_g1_i1.p1 TRINITY_DN3030_c0_g1~~TRINITY_DN3030_c0_g1_i1.p1  ORF type:complete len:1425 (-),score=404.51 TRINITY_DN3030_c0_g1_i1:196-4470(-)